MTATAPRVLEHQPVMVAEIVAGLAPREGGIYVDGTFGAGGYSRALLDAAPCTVYGIDRDPDALARGRALAVRDGRRLELIQGRFGDMDTLLAAHGVAAVDGVALDLGVSSPQIDDPARGFSFRADGPLDMRMEREGPSAADAVNTLSEADLAEILRNFGEEKFARRIARAICAARERAPIVRTGELAAIARQAIPAAGSATAIDPATRTFQALRIYVNDELGELDRGLIAAETILCDGGRLAVVSFHSLEDRAVKTFLAARSGRRANPSRHQPQPSADDAQPSFRPLTRKPLRPSVAEAAANPRARSARLRIAERTAAPARRPG